MNATEQATSLEMLSKIATIVNLFKASFPDTLADLNPWLDNSETKQFADPSSLDLSFHFIQYKNPYNCRCILMQIYLKRETLTQQVRAIGIELTGHDCRGQQWRLSTLGSGQATGMTPPTSEGSRKLMEISDRILGLFNSCSDRYIPKLNEF